MVLGDALRLAFGTLTAVPVPPPSRVDRRVAGLAMRCAPLAGVVPGAVAAVVCLSGPWLDVPRPAAAALAVGAVALSSRGLHLDGLADTADGLAASYDRARALAVMRSGDVGPAGATTLVLLLLAQVACVAALIGSWRGVLLVGGAVVASRSVLAICCATGVPSARPAGLGATVAGSVPVAAAVSLALATAAVAGLGGAALGRPWWLGAVAVTAGFAAAAVLLRRCVRRLGGVTGDVLGACVEVALTAALVVLATRPG